MVDVSVVVVGLNARGFVQQCWDTVKTAGFEGSSYEMIYVDNGSTDDTLAMLRERHPDVKVIANPSNLGFCKAVNQGAHLASGRYLFLLNDDVIVLDHAIEKLAASSTRIRR